MSAVAQAMQLDQPNIELPLASSYNQRGIAGYTNAVTNAKDQRKVNSIYEPVKNALTGKTTLYLTKRPGVADVGSSYGTSGQVAYVWDIAAGATTNLAANRWVFSTSGNDIRASDTSTTTVIATASGYAPAFVDKTQISGTDTLLVQLRNASGTQTAWHSTTIGTFTQISDSDFTGLAHQGKIEHLDGYALVSTRNRVYNSDLNSLSSWGANSYIARQVTQDIGTGLAKFGSQIISFGTSTMEVFRNAGNPTGSPLEAVPQLAKDIGLPSTIVTGQRHYYTTVENKLYWRGNPAGVYAYNGETVEKVSNLAIDKILSERQHYFVGRISFQGQRAVAIGLDLPDAATQRALLFFPAWNEWFEFSSTVFIPQTSPRLEDVCLGVGSNQHKLYAVSQSSDNWQDAGTNYPFTHQFVMPKKGNGIERMYMFGVMGDTSASALNLAVEFSDDDFTTFSTARNIDMTGTKKALYGCGSYRSTRAVRISYTGSLNVRLEQAIARVG
jgi:hypothetical protein